VYNSLAYPRACPRLANHGKSCAYVVYGDRSFKHHLVIHCHMKWMVLRRRPRPSEEITPMTVAEAWERRVSLSSRQGGRGECLQKRLLETRRAERNSKPPSPRLLQRYNQPLQQRTSPPSLTQRGGSDDSVAVGSQ